MQRKNFFNANTAGNFSDRYCCADARAVFLGDDQALKCLDSFLVAFLYFLMDNHSIASSDFREIFFQLFVNHFHNQVVEIRQFKIYGCQAEVEFHYLAKDIKNSLSIKYCLNYIDFGILAQISFCFKGI